MYNNHKVKDLDELAVIIMSISSFLFIIHGFTGGLFEMPDKFNICAMAERLCEAKDDRLSKQEKDKNETNI